MKRQNGFILFIAMVMLVLLTVIGIALVRAVDTTNEVASNIGFVQSTLISSDSGLETAATWLQSNPSLLNADSLDDGYYARDIGRLAELANKVVDYTGSLTPSDASDDVNWDGASFSSAAYKAMVLPSLDSAGNKISYIIERLCDNYGSPGLGAVRCARMSLRVTGGSSKSGAGGYGGQAITSKSQVYYRITARAKGPRNTASYTQSTIIIEY